MKLEALKAKKFQTAENSDLNKLMGGDVTSSQSTTYRYGRVDARVDSDSSGSGSAGGTASASVVNGVVTFDA
jgi:hypothetical protein